MKTQKDIIKMVHKKWAFNPSEKIMRSRKEFKRRDKHQKPLGVGDYLGNLV